MHENAEKPPGLSDKGKLRSGTKLQILGCLSATSRFDHAPASKQASVLILDMATVIHMVRPTRAKVFWEHTHMHFCHSWKSPKHHVPQECMQYRIANISTVWRIKLVQNDKKVEVSSKCEFPQKSQFLDGRIGKSFWQSSRTKTNSSNIYPLDLSALHPIMRHVV